jgi:hypothetical protein
MSRVPSKICLGSKSTEIGIFCGPFGIFWTFLEFCTKKNLATLRLATVGGPHRVELGQELANLGPI